MKKARTSSRSVYVVAIVLATVLVTTSARLLMGQVSSTSSLPPPTIIDNSTTGKFTTAPADAWTNIDINPTYGSTYHNDVAISFLVDPATLRPIPSPTATFNATLKPGKYTLQTTWLAYALFSNQAIYTVNVNNAAVGFQKVNQQIAPSGTTVDGVTWQDLGTVEIHNPNVSVVVSNPTLPTGYNYTTSGALLQADAVRFVPVEIYPHANVVTQVWNGPTSATVTAGQQNVTLLAFDIGASQENVGAFLQTLKFKQALGDDWDQEYSLWIDTNYDGSVDTKAFYGAMAHDGIIVMKNPGQQSAPLMRLEGGKTIHAELRADISRYATVGKRLQYQFNIGDDKFIEAYDAQGDGLPLTGICVDQPQGTGCDIHHSTATVHTVFTVVASQTGGSSSATPSSAATSTGVIISSAGQSSSAASSYASGCSPYMCTDGTVAPRCSGSNNTPVFYLLNPCLFHGGEGQGSFSSAQSSQAANGADLTVTIDPSNTTPVAGHVYTVGITVRNLGTTTVPSFVVRLPVPHYLTFSYADTVTDCQTDHDSADVVCGKYAPIALAAGESKHFNVGFAAPATAPCITTPLDVALSYIAVPDSNTSNNVAHTDLPILCAGSSSATSVNGPDIQLSIDPFTAAVAAGQSYNVGINVVNNGGRISSFIIRIPVPENSTFDYGNTVSDCQTDHEHDGAGIVCGKYSPISLGTGESKHFNVGFKVNANTASCSQILVNAVLDSVNTMTSRGNHTTGTLSLTCSSSSVGQNACGNGVVNSGEACDDANTQSGDGCSSTCTVEMGYRCQTAGQVCTPICGDGIKKASEQCDDANTQNGDGCSSTCTQEPGWTCNGVSCSRMAANASCGDNTVPTTVSAGRAFTGTLVVRNTGDRPWTGNNFYLAIPQDQMTTFGRTNGGAGWDGWPSTTVQSGQSVTSTLTGTAPRQSGTYHFDWRMVQNTVEAFGDNCTRTINVIAVCGDNIKDSTEQCDDGNTVNGDGCSSTCRTEAATSLVNGSTCGAIAAPDQVVAGQLFAAYVTMQNTGTKVWTQPGHYLVDRNWREPKWATTQVPLPFSPVGVGQSVTFTIAGKAPMTAGTYDFNWNMSESNVDSFINNGCTKRIVVVPAGSVSNNASCIGMNVPQSVVAGRPFAASMTMKNTGTKIWSSPNHYIFDNAQTSVWGAGSINMPATPIQPGSAVTFSFTPTAPSTPGSYDFNWKMLENGVETFGENCKTTVNVTAATNTIQGSLLQGSLFDLTDFLRGLFSN